MRRLQANGIPFVAVNLEPVFGSIDDYAAIVESAMQPKGPTPSGADALGLKVGECWGALWQEFEAPGGAVIAVATVPLRTEHLTGIVLSAAFLVEQELWKEFAAKVHMAAPNVLRAINPRHNPTQDTLNRLLKPFKLRLSLTPLTGKPRRTAA